MILEFQQFLKMERCQKRMELTVAILAQGRPDLETKVAAKGTSREWPRIFVTASTLPLDVTCAALSVGARLCHPLEIKDLPQTFHQGSQESIQNLHELFEI